jgi:hypothetical protein
VKDLRLHGNIVTGFLVGALVSVRNSWCDLLLTIALVELMQKGKQNPTYKKE